MATASTPTPSLSPIDAARDAIQHTRRRLFPFRFETWLVLGFLAFLDQCGRGGTWSFPGGWQADHGGRRGGERALTGLDPGLAWLSEHATLVGLGILLAVLVGAAVLALVLWINARGTFMYLDAVLTGRAEVSRPWREHKARADSYFAWSFGIALGMLLVVALAIALLGAVALAFARGRLTPFSAGAVLVGLLPVFLLLLLALPLLALAGLALRDFVAPLQIAARLPCGEAARRFEGLVVAQPGAFVLYLLLKIVFRMVLGAVIVVGGCLTCCLGFLPVVMQTLFQPLFHFERAWPVFLLRRMGYDLPTPTEG